MVNFYNHFIPHASLVMAPLFAAVAGKKGKESISWDTLNEQAFANTKSALATATLLHHPQYNAASPSLLMPVILA